MKKLLSCFSVLLAALFLLTGTQPASAEEAEPGVDWVNNVIVAKGEGAPPANAVSAAQGRMMARRAAVVDAYRQLAETINGVHVESGSSVQDYILQSDLTRTNVDAVIKGARVIKEWKEEDGGYAVLMEVPIFGVSKSLSSAIMPKPSTPPIAFPAPTAPPVTQVEVTVNTPSGQGGYTGVIVDCKGLGLNPVMSPVIKNAAGNKIYGHENLDYDLVIRDGMVSYANDRSQAGRAGSNPIVVRAESLSDHNANPVISVNDANLILTENNSSGFLSKTAVVFMY